jgi:membrane protein YdbS with pleckstrin-like domain
MFENSKLQALLFAILFVAIDLYFFSLRCSSSPDVNWSIFAFCATLQAVTVAIPIIAEYVYSDWDVKIRRKTVLVAAFMTLSIIPMARTPILLSDTINDKYYRSKGYECPGVNSWVGI